MSQLLEDKLIARVLSDGSAQRALSLGVVDTWFNDPICRATWQAIVEHGNRPATRNSVPSLARLTKLVPSYVPMPRAPEEPIQEIIADLNESRARGIIQAGIVDVDTLLRTQGVEIAIAHLSEIARDLQRNTLTPSHLECGLSDAIPEFISDYERVAQGGGIVGIPFPWHPLNSATGGLQPGTLNVIYAPSKNGKTWIGLEVGVVHPFEAGNARCLMVSNEMPIKQIWRRILARLCRLEYGQVTSGTIPLDARDRSFDMLSQLQEQQLLAMREAMTGGYRDIMVI
ncbi:MAG: DnaB-like helicase C-terminal domain-containing protein, partial [Candidatus Limnocylindrus sp.]